MSVETWGLMPKSQIDPETIEQAITRLIRVHEADPTSHLGENESIDAHRKSEIIDHLAGSVKNDKTSFREFYYDLKFSDYATWSKYKASVGYSFYQYLDGIYFDTSQSNAALYNRLYKYHINDFPTPSSFYLTASVISEYGPDINGYWSFGRFDSYLTIDRVCGFKYKNSKLYATLFNSTGEVNYDYQIVGINIFDETEHNLRFSYSVTEAKYEWYIDGVLVYTYDNSANTFPPSIINSSGGFDFKYTWVDGVSFVVYCYDYVFSVDPTY